MMSNEANTAEETVLLDRVVFRLDSEAFDLFTGMLNEPPAPTEELRALFLTKSPWE